VRRRRFASAQWKERQVSKPCPDEAGVSRRILLQGGLGLAALSTSPLLAPTPAAAAQTPEANGADMSSGTVTAKDGAQIYYKDWGAGQPIVFHHGWPLSSDDWDAHLMFFLAQGYRVIAHDRRGHGRSTQVDHGYDMDTFADDVAALVAHLDLKAAIHVGHSMGGGEVIRYVARHGGGGRVSRAVTIGGVPPIMLKTAANPGGLPMEAFDGFRSGLLANRAQFFRDVPAGPFFGFNRPDAKVSDGTIQNWWRQGMMGAIKAQYDCIRAFSETDFTEDLGRITAPVLVMHGEDDQIVPIADSALFSVKLLKAGRLKTYPGLSHGMHTTHHEVIDADILAFIRS
jgi:non-heme chloroperoxidase